MTREKIDLDLENLETRVVARGEKKCPRGCCCLYDLPLMGYSLRPSIFLQIKTDRKKNHLGFGALCDFLIF